MTPGVSCPLVVKICGITSLEDALVALDAGADMLGFNFYPGSKRCISPAVCREITQALKSRKLKVVTVGVFVNQPVEYIREVMQECGVHLAQLSGDEPPEALNNLGGSGIKALRLHDSASLEAYLWKYPRRALPPAYLIDAYSPGEYGGTGRTMDWSLAAEISARMPILLAGGLTPENIGQAIAQVHPWGVDVASGVEASPGMKDHARLQRFIQQARAAR